MAWLSRIAVVDQARMEAMEVKAGRAREQQQQQTS
jgi:hypothetical protein